MSSNQADSATPRWVEIAAWSALGALIAAVLTYGLWLAFPRHEEPSDLRRLRQVNRVLELLGIHGGDTRVGQLSRDADRLAEARRLIDHLERGLAAAPASSGRAQILYLRGIERLTSNDDAGAQQALQEAQKLDPDAIPINLALGTVHFRRADYDWAVLAFRRVIERDPDNRAGLHNLGQTLYILGQRDEALRLYGRLSELEAADRAAAAQKAVPGAGAGAERSGSPTLSLEPAQP